MARRTETWRTRDTYSEEDVSLGAANALRSVYDLLRPGGELGDHDALSFFAAALYRMSEEAKFVTLPETSDAAADLLGQILERGYVDESEL
jgi:hypothetical protein